MKARLQYVGRFRTAVWVADESGRFRGYDYFKSASLEERARLQTLIERQCDEQIGIRDKTKFRHEGDQIWAFKSFQHRLLCFFDGPRVCITNGLRKKRDKMPPNAIQIAKRIREFYRSPREH